MTVIPDFDTTTRKPGDFSTSDALHARYRALSDREIEAAFAEIQLEVPDDAAAAASTVRTGRG